MNDAEEYLCCFVFCFVYFSSSSFLLLLFLCSDLKVESIANEIHITFIHHNGKGEMNIKLVGNQCTPVPPCTSPLNKYIVLLLLNQVVLFCPFYPMPDID